MSKAETEPKKVGGIATLSSSSVYQNYGQNFIDAKKFGRNDVVFFNLGVRAEDIKTVYGKDQVDKQKYEQIPKFYKDGEALKEYNNGKEAKDECSKIVDILSSLQKNYGNKAFFSKVREDLNQRIGVEMTALGRLYNAEDYPENLSKARMTSSAKANRDMQSHLLNLRNDASLPDDLKKQIENSLNLIRENQNPKIPLEKVKDAAVSDLNHPDKSPGEVEELDKKIKKEIDLVLKTATDRNISNSSIRSLAAISNEDANLRMTVSTDYSKVLSLTKDSVARLEKISQEISQLTPLAYSGAIISIKGAKPTKEEMSKAYTQLLIEQQAITGIDPADKDFHAKVKALDHKILGKIEVSFQGSPPDDKVQRYTIDNKKFVKSLAKIDKPEMLQLSQNVTFKTDSRDLSDYSINSTTLLQQLKSQDPGKYGKLSQEDLGNLTIELKFRKPGTDIKPEQEKTPMEKARDENLKVLNDNSTSKDAFKNAIGARPENIESAILTYTDKSGNKQQIPLTLSQLGQMKDRISVKPAASVQFFDLSTQEKTTAVNSLSKIVGKHPEKSMKLERDNSKKASKSTDKKLPLQISEPTQLAKDPIQPKVIPPNLVFPAEALEVFHKTQSKDMNIEEKITQLGKKDFAIDIPKTAATTLAPTPLSKANEELKQKLQTRPVITQAGLVAKPATKASELNTPRVSAFAQVQAALSKRDEELKKRLQKRVDSMQSNITAKPAPKTIDIPVQDLKTQFAQRTVEGPATKSGMRPLPPLPDNASSPKHSTKIPPPVPPRTDKLKDAAALAGSTTPTVKNSTPPVTIQTSRPELKGKPLPLTPPQQEMMRIAQQVLKKDGMELNRDQQSITSNNRIKIGMRGKKDDTHTH